jgi:putative ABC transport system permease protein
MSRTGRIIANASAVLGRNRVRTFLMMIGTFAGVTALTVLLAFSRGTRQEIVQRVNSMLSGSSIFLRAGGMQVAGGPHGGGPTTTLELGDLEAIRRDVPDVVHADPMLTTNREVMANGHSTETQVFGHSEASEIVWNRSVSRGSYFSSADVAASARVALIGETLAVELFGESNPVGEHVRIAGQPFQVIGVLEPMGVDPHGIDRDRDLIIPISTMMRRVLNIDYIIAARIMMTSGADLDRAVGQIKTLLRGRHSLAPDQADDFAMFTPVQVQEMVASTDRVFSVFLPVVAGASLLIAALVVATLMLMTVNERRAEIGLRRAIGARARDIRLQFLTEAATITTVAGALAIAVSYGILSFLSSHAIRPGVSLPWGVAAIGLGTAVAVGVTAGIAPARRAAALDPANTLR